MIAVIVVLLGLLPRDVQVFLFIAAKVLAVLVGVAL
jgi:hypothetical protein